MFLCLVSLFIDNFLSVDDIDSLDRLAQALAGEVVDAPLSPIFATTLSALASRLWMGE